MVHLTQEQEARVRALKASGHAIVAIKEVREITGLGLREAKDLVDKLPAGAGAGRGDEPVHAVAPALTLPRLLLIAAALLALAAIVSWIASR